MYLFEHFLITIKVFQTFAENIVKGREFKKRRVKFPHNLSSNGRSYEIVHSFLSLFPER